MNRYWVYWEDRALWFCGWQPHEGENIPIWGPKRHRVIVTKSEAEKTANRAGGAFRFYPNAAEREELEARGQARVFED